MTSALAIEIQPTAPKIFRPKYEMTEHAEVCGDLWPLARRKNEICLRNDYNIYGECDCEGQGVYWQAIVRAGRPLGQRKSSVNSEIVPSHSRRVIYVNCN